MTWKTILVTGGAGFVGSAVVRKLLENEQHRVVVIDNLFNGQPTFLPESERLIFHEADLRDRETLIQLVQELRPDCVIHLAAIHFIPYCNSHPSETMDVNVTGMQSLLDALRETPPESLVVASTAAVYPIWDEASSESGLAAAPTDIYGISKWMNEKQLELFASQTSTRCAAARFFNVYGPRETNPHVIPEILDQLHAGSTEIELGNIKPKRDYIFTDDVARAVLMLAERNTEPFREYNVGTGAEYSVEELVEKLSEISGQEITIKTDPARVRKSERMHLLCDLSRIREEIGWEPEYDLDRGMRELWDWSKANSNVITDATV